MMKAYSEVPSSEAVEVVESTPVPTPDPKKGEIVVKVARAACNPGDVKIVEGGVPRFIYNPKFPVTIGLDFAGIVYAIPDGVDAAGLAVGDRVCGWNEVINGEAGAFAEYVTCVAKRLARIPSGLSFEDAAAIPHVASCARPALLNTNLKRGMNLLVFGGSSAIGLFVTAMAKDVGCDEIVCTSTAEDLCKSFGATRVINYREVDPVQVLSIGSEGPTFDRSVDTAQGYSAWMTAKKLVKKNGNHISFVIDEPRAPPHVTSAFGTIVGIACKAICRGIAGACCCGGPGYTMYANQARDDTRSVIDYYLTLRASGKMPSPVDATVAPFPFTTEGLVAMLLKQQSGSCKGKLILDICPEMK